MAVHKKYNSLGRGLDALISTDAVRTQGSSTINEIAIDQIEANPNQPRREFDDEALQELASSSRLRCVRQLKTDFRLLQVNVDGELLN